jgi:hypothetical protein
MNMESQALPEGESQGHPSPKAKAGEDSIFDLGDSGGSNIAVDKDSMIAEAFDLMRKGCRT